MDVFALVRSERWRDAVRGAVGSTDALRFFDDVAAAVEAHRAQPATAIVLEWAAYADVDLAQFGREEAPAVIALVENTEALRRALDAGASDGETEPDAIRVAHRIEVATTQNERHRRIRADAGMLRIMTASADSEARLWEYDIVGQRFTRVHPAAPSANRHSSDRLAELSWTDLYPRASRHRVRDAVAACIERFRATGEIGARSLDLEMHNADGTTGFRRVTISIGLDRRGEPTLVRGVTWDTTELVRAKASLATVGASVASLLESLPVPLLTLSSDGTILSWNPAAERVFGYTSEEVVGAPFALDDGADPSFFARVVLPASSCRAPLDGVESVCRRKDGEVLHVAMWTGPMGHGFALPDDSIFMIVADVDQRKRAELEYRHLFEAAHDAILVFDPEDETILDVNARGGELYGRTREEMIGKSLRSFSADPDRGREKVRETMQSGALLRFETVQYRKTGERMILDVNASRITYRGRPAILSINRDVTAQRAHAEELRRRDRALAEASKLEAVGRLAGGIAHDFNNLLMVIGGCSEIITSTHDESSPYAAEISDLEGAFTRAKALVRRLLTFARQGPSEVRTFRILEVLDPLRSILRRLVGEDIELVTHLEGCADICVRMDPSQLEQVIVNLVVNARDAISGVGVIRIDVGPSARDGFVELTVKDDGIGMDEATRSRVFEPFFTTKELGKGTGLGLATTHGIVSAAGGEISVVSALGRGTTFQVLLPIEERPPESLSSRRRRSPSRPGSESILLVEDEPAVRRILARELRRFGYDVLESENGAEALELAADFESVIDLLVTDVVMPKMSGDELARRLRLARPEIKVLFMTGYTERHVVREIAERGLGPVLSKPFGPAKLMENVRALLENSAM
ncbi:MAG: PAS domain S-box protein [Polyangiaceae bacterium]